MMTQRYIHPQAESIERAFLQMGTRQELVIDGGQSKKIECWE